MLHLPSAALCPAPVGRRSLLLSVLLQYLGFECPSFPTCLTMTLLWLSMMSEGGIEKAEAWNRFSGNVVGHPRERLDRDRVPRREGAPSASLSKAHAGAPQLFYVPRIRWGSCPGSAAASG